MADDKPKANWFDLIWKNGTIALLALMVAQQLGWISSEQADKLKQVLPHETHGPVEPEPAPTPEPKPNPEPQPVEPEKADSLTADEIRQMIRDIVSELLIEDVQPKPEPASELKILVVDETGAPLDGTEVESGQLFRVSAVGASDSIGWHPVKSGDVRLSASTDGKEFAGYLTAGQWIEFGLTDFGTKQQLSVRISCNQGPQPPPDPKPEPKPDDKTTAKNVHIFVVYNPKQISPDAAIVLNANDMWDSFTAAGNDWKYIDWSTEDSDEKSVVRDASGIGLPAVVIYDKSSGKKLTAEELPKSVIATEGLVERYTGGK